MSRSMLANLAGFSLVLACGGGSDAAARKAPAAGDEAPVAEADEKVAPATEPTALPPERPNPFEIEYRIKPKDDGALVTIKLTPDGIRYTTGDHDHRITLTYESDPAAIDRVYTTLRESAFDRIETKPSREGGDSGTSLKLVAGTIRHAVSDMGRVYPEPQWEAAYDEMARVMESLLPSRDAKKSLATIDIRWDASMLEHRASVDLPLGAAFAGITRAGPTHADVTVHLAEAGRAVDLLLRHGPPAAQSTHRVDPSKHAGALVTFDPELAIPSVRLLTADELAALPQPGAAPGKADAPKAPTSTSAP